LRDSVPSGPPPPLEKMRFAAAIYRTATGIQEQCIDLPVRHSFASLPLHEGRSMIYFARELGHDARITLGTYGHVIDELECPSG
jgi:hypothetical protein